MYIHNINICIHQCAPCLSAIQIYVYISVHHIYPQYKYMYTSVCTIYIRNTNICMHHCAPCLSTIQLYVYISVHHVYPQYKYMYTSVCTMYIHNTNICIHQCAPYIYPQYKYMYTHIHHRRKRILHICTITFDNFCETKRIVINVSPVIQITGTCDKL